jgi:broad specificity phosphatase PhoE
MMPLIASLLLLAATAPAPMQPVPGEPGLPEGTARVFLIRHAEKGGSGKDPDLSDAGKARAEELYKLLEKTKIDLVIVSDTKRTAETADHTARQHGLTPMVVSTAGGVDKHVREVVDAVRAVRPGGTVLIVGHSNTVPLIVKELGGPTLPAMCEGEFAPVFQLSLSGDGTPPKLTKSSYGAPDPSGASDCAR